MEFQTTLQSPFSLSGYGLHTGQYISVKVEPAPANSGIFFRVVKDEREVLIPALADFVTGTNHGTTLTRDGVSVSTIEHLMSALHGLRIDNALISVDGAEIPILDGSAKLWVDAILNAGISQLQSERLYIDITEDLLWEDLSAGISLSVSPSSQLQINSTIVFESSLIGSQSAEFSDYNQYVSQFAACRTFVFLHEIEQLLAANLIKGGALDNALVFVDRPLEEQSKHHLARVYQRDPESLQVEQGVLNTVKPYFTNEPARHKLLDFMGDIYLVGRPIRGSFSLRCPGHRANVALASAIRNKFVN